MFVRLFTHSIALLSLTVGVSSDAWGLTLAQRLAQDPLPSGRQAREAWLRRQVAQGGRIDS